MKKHEKNADHLEVFFTENDMHNNHHFPPTVTPQIIPSEYTKRRELTYQLIPEG